MLPYIFDTQLMIAGQSLSEDEINAQIRERFDGDSLLVFGDESLIRIHYHTNTPWAVLEYCASLGEIHDIVIENMDRQQRGEKG